MAQTSHPIPTPRSTLLLYHRLSTCREAIDHTLLELDHLLPCLPYLAPHLHPEVPLSARSPPICVETEKWFFIVSYDRTYPVARLLPCQGGPILFFHPPRPTFHQVIRIERVADCYVEKMIEAGVEIEVVAAKMD